MEEFRPNSKLRPKSSNFGKGSKFLYGNPRTIKKGGNIMASKIQNQITYKLGPQYKILLSKYSDKVKKKFL